MPASSFNMWNSESWWLESVPGELLLFPSNLEHMVESTKSTETRISLSFNTFLSGKIGEDRELTLLDIK